MEWTFELVQQLAQTGLLGLLLSLSVIGNVLQYRANQALQEKRVNDIKQAKDLLMEPLKAIKQTVDLILTLVQADIKRYGSDNN